MRLVGGALDLLQVGDILVSDPAGLLDRDQRAVAGTSQRRSNRSSVSRSR